MVGDDPACAIEPEGGNLREDLALVGNARAEDVIKRGDPIGRDDEETVPEVVEISDLALLIGRAVAERCLKRGAANGNRFPREAEPRIWQGVAEPDNNNM
jgi:hypothetical protein